MESSVPGRGPGRCRGPARCAESPQSRQTDALLAQQDRAGTRQAREQAQRQAQESRATGRGLAVCHVVPTRPTTLARVQGAPNLPALARFRRRALKRPASPAPRARETPDRHTRAGPRPAQPRRPPRLERRVPPTHTPTHTRSRLTHTRTTYTHTPERDGINETSAGGRPRKATSRRQQRATLQGRAARGFTTDSRQESRRDGHRKRQGSGSRSGDAREAARRTLAASHAARRAAHAARPPRYGAPRPDDGQAPPGPHKLDDPGRAGPGRAGPIRARSGRARLSRTRAGPWRRAAGGRR